MPIEKSWLQPDRVIFQRYVGTVTLEDLDESQRLSTSWLETGTPPIHHVVDMSTVEEYPKSLSQFKNTLYSIRDPRLGWVIIIADRPVVRFLASIIAQIVVPQGRLKLFDTLDAGLRFLAEQDSTLAPLMPETPQSL